MKPFKMYCISLNPSHLELIKKIDYVPVGLGETQFNVEWLTDKPNDNISIKNKFYGEYTFHYWILKDLILKRVIFSYLRIGKILIRKILYSQRVIFI